MLMDDTGSTNVQRAEDRRLGNVALSGLNNKLHTKTVTKCIYSMYGTCSMLLASIPVAIYFLKSVINTIIKHNTIYKTV